MKATREEVIQELHAMVRANGNKLPTQMMFRNNSKTGTRFVTLFGTWNQFVKEAGYVPTRVYYLTEDVEPAIRDNVVLALMETEEQHPDWPTTKLMRNCGVSPKLVRHIFPSVRDVNDLLGRKMNKKGGKQKRISVQELKDTIRDLALQYPDEKYPTNLIVHSSHAHSLFSKYMSAKEILDIMNRARAGRSYTKRYPVKYKSAPAALRWMRRRFEPVKATV